MSDPSNDNTPAGVSAPFSPDAHGQAAMLLVENLIHELVARSVISVAVAVEIVEGAVEVSRVLADEPGQEAAAQQRATDILVSLSRSLSTDLTSP